MTRLKKSIQQTSYGHCFSFMLASKLEKNSVSNILSFNHGNVNNGTWTCHSCNTLLKRKIQCGRTWKTERVPKVYLYKLVH